jgi:hypothetical protein
MKKVKKSIEGYYNNQKVVVDMTSEYEDYYLVHYADSIDKSKFKISVQELNKEADGSK